MCLSWSELEPAVAHVRVFLLGFYRRWAIIFQIHFSLVLCPADSNLQRIVHTSTTVFLIFISCLWWTWRSLDECYSFLYLIFVQLTFDSSEISSINLNSFSVKDFPDSFHSWNFLSSIGSGITFLSFAIFFLFLFLNRFSLFGFIFVFFGWHQRF